MADAASALRVDDVVHGYRWILGREPESLEVIQSLLALKDPVILRSAILDSPEFQQKLNDLGLPRRLLPVVQPLDPEIDRFVFLHIPKTGGTTLHTLMASAVGADRVMGERHNGLWFRSGAEFACARLFSGHYDRRCLSMVPGRRVRVVTLLREPGRRLLSIYKFLRAHSPQIVARDNLALAGAARELSYGEFLKAAMEINPATVDNAYLRAFGAHLPTARWEQRAEPAAHKKLHELDEPVEKLAHRARDFLDQMAAVGILEDFDLSLSAIFAALGLPLPETYEVQMRLSDLIIQNPAFEPVEDFEICETDRRLVADLTVYDAELYCHARTRLVNAVSGTAAIAAGAAENPSGIPAGPTSNA